VAGTLSAVTARQVEELHALRDVAIVTLDTREVERCRASVVAALETGRDCVLLAPRNIEAEDPRQVARALGAVAADCARSGALGGLILTGGETARAVSRALGATSLDLVGEVEPGVPLTMLVGHTSSGLLCVTKAGAFGSSGTLVRALDHLKGSST
jgi:uncharacterized protein YgbK (DUF1537 family)